MKNTNIKKLMENCNSRYSLVAATAKRARQIQDDANEKEERLQEKAVTMAIEEIESGKYVVEEPDSLKSDIK